MTASAASPAKAAFDSLDRRKSWEPLVDRHCRHVGVELSIPAFGERAAGAISYAAIGFAAGDYNGIDVAAGNVDVFQSDALHINVATATLASIQCGCS